jgi:hypothetical protein
MDVIECKSVFDSPIGPNGGCIFANPNVWLDVEPVELPSHGGGIGGGGRRSERPSYREGPMDALEQTRRKRILAEDDDIVALITAMLGQGLM